MFSYFWVVLAFTGYWLQRAVYWLGFTGYWLQRAVYWLVQRYLRNQLGARGSLEFGFCIVAVLMPVLTICVAKAILEVLAFFNVR